MRKIVGKNFLLFYLLREKMIEFSHFSVLSTKKDILHTFYVLLFSPYKKRLTVTVLKVSTIKQAFIEKVQQ